MNKLADKNCYPFTIPSTMLELKPNLYYSGLTFRERLIVALAGNPEMIGYIRKDTGSFYDREKTAEKIIKQADAIIAEMEKER